MATTLAGPASHEEEVKKSRFVARASAATSPEEALAFLEQVRDPQATHNCWAYRIGARYRFADDGEPGGTAGRPILGAIERQGLDHVVVVVTRFFGGIKLGAGGLARAYGGVAASCLRLAAQVPLDPRVAARLQASFAATGLAYELLGRFGATERQEQYTDSGVILLFSLKESQVGPFREELRQASRGALALELR